MDAAGHIGLWQDDGLEPEHQLESELIRLQLAAKLDPTLAADLEPDYPNTNPTVGEGAGSQESMRLLHTAGLMLNEYEQLKGWMGLAAPGIGQGSNAWVVSGKKTTSGRPVLCNDPHLVMSMPGAWYEVHLNCRAVGEFQPRNPRQRCLVRRCTGYHNRPQ